MGKTIDFKKAAQKQKRSRDNRLWRTLLDCMDAIVDLCPWTAAGPDTPFVYIPDGYDQMIFFSCVQDKEDASFGVIVYPSPQEYLAATQERATGREEMRSYIESDVYTVSYTPCREDVPEDMLKVYRRLGLDFTGDLWPWAIHKRRGYLGAVPEGDDLAFLLDCMGNFHMQVKALCQGALRGKLKEGDMVLRFRLEDGREPWKNTILPFAELKLPPAPRNPVIMRESSEKLKELRGLPIAEQVQQMEFDFSWLAEPVQDKPSAEPFFPIVAVVTDRKSGEPLAIRSGQPEDLLDCAFDAWQEALRKCGVPKTLYISRDESLDLFDDFAKKLGVKCKQVKHLPAATKVLRNCGAV